MSDPDNEEEVNRLMETRWKEIDHLVTYKEVSGGKIWENIQGELGQPEKSTKSNARQLRIEPWKIAASVAATFLVLAILIFTPYGYNTKDPLVTLSSAKGEQRTVKLPDGSIVTLNINSSVSFPEEFDPEHRYVTLEGEAFFDVMADDSYPFTVTTKDLSITAYGTEFNVNSRFKDKVEVGLFEGKVQVQDKTSQSLNMLPSDHINYNSITGEIYKKELDSSAIAWKGEIFAVDGASFQETVDYLEDWYGIQIFVNGEPSKEWSYRAKFKNQKLEEVLRSMAFVHEFDFETSDSTAIIHIN
jgi:ferric-dicitrate binding protein FerR (iron transport regulator)